MIKHKKHSAADDGPDAGQVQPSDWNDEHEITNAAAVRAALGLGTAATKNTGTSGEVVPLLNTANTFSANQSFNGFVRLGESALGIKVKVLTGTTPAAEGGNAATPHGVDSSKIVMFAVVVHHATNGGVTPGYTQVPGYQFDLYYDAASAVVALHPTNSENILSKPFTSLIVYTE